MIRHAMDMAMKCKGPEMASYTACDAGGGKHKKTVTCPPEFHILKAVKDGLNSLSIPRLKGRCK